MHFSQVRWCMGLLLCLTGLGLFAWGAWPAGKRLSILMIRPAEMQLSFSGQAYTDGEGYATQTPITTAAILETRRLVLETPNFIRLEDQAEVNLGFIQHPVLNMGEEIEGLSNLFDTHHVSVEARLEIGGLQVEPSGTLIRPLAAGQAASFTWFLWADQVQSYEGTAWFYLRFRSKDGSTSSSWPLAAQRVELSSYSLLGLSGSLARRLGGMGVLSGLLLLTDWLVRRLSLRLGISSAEAAR
jgi:hypothetical protein